MKIVEKIEELSKREEHFELGEDEARSEAQAARSEAQPILEEE